MFELNVFIILIILNCLEWDNIIRVNENKIKRVFCLNGYFVGFLLKYIVKVFVFLFWEYIGRIFYKVGIKKVMKLMVNVCFFSRIR